MHPLWKFQKDTLKWISKLDFSTTKKAFYLEGLFC